MRHSTINVKPRGVVLYGAGGFSAWVKERLAAAGVDVVAHFDVAGSYDVTHPVRHLDTVSHDELDYPVLISIFNHYTDVHEVGRTLQRRGFSTVLYPAELLPELPVGENDHSVYWLGSRSAMLPLKEQEDRLRTLLADHESVELLDGLLDLRRGLWPDLRVYPLGVHLQYCLPERGFIAGSLSTVIDCGAFDGDSIRNWLSNGMDADAIVAFEPDGANLPGLRESLQQHPGSGICIQAALGQTSGLVDLVGSGLGTRVQGGPTGSVPVVRLDDVMATGPVSLIKMDIEGSELDALIGGAETIRRSRPRLAISVYHRPSDLWRLPFLVDDLDLGYRFYLRCYGHSAFDVVLYCL